MAHRTARRDAGSLGPRLVAAAVVLWFGALAVPFGWSDVVASLLLVLLPVLLLSLAPCRRARGWLRASSAVALVLIGGGFLLLLASRGVDPLDHWLGGLPLPLGIQVWVLALAPLLCLGLLFGLAWERWAPSVDTLAELEALIAVEEAGREEGRGD